VPHQGSTPRLAARISAQLARQRRQLRVERFDHRQRDRDLLARARR
jgi:hypothetical protein